MQPHQGKRKWLTVKYSLYGQSINMQIDLRNFGENQLPGKVCSTEGIHHVGTAIVNCLKHSLF